MKKVLLFVIFLGISVTLSAQKVSIEPGIGLGFGILTSGGSQSSNSQGGIGIALQAGLYYHFDSQFSIGLFGLAQDPVMGGEFSTAQEVRFSPAHNRARFLSVNGRYAFNKKERDHFFFVGLGLGQKRMLSYIRVNDVEIIERSDFSVMPELGFQMKNLQIVLSFTTPVPSPTFDQVGNDDGIRYVMESGFVSTLQYSIRYQFRLLNKK
ncbi:hypothetical protein [Pararhodonellum marinum]|uniref:hypothetical protein n=1 Tax=Pararhodonellum marinum TaxID=2755358 RepID=UPI00188EF6F9|nr:hypothetical protein [Pararhodonellum marinum]